MTELPVAVESQWQPQPIEQQYLPRVIKIVVDQGIAFAVKVIPSESKEIVQNE